MSSSESTCWVLISAARDGDARAREDFARRYASPIRAYLAARWRGNAYQADLEDACQEVFIECFRLGGVLEKAQSGQPGGFRAYLYGVVRNVALRFEERRARSHARRPEGPVPLDERQADDTSLSLVFDREWARGVLREAVTLHAERARAEGPEAERRFELLRLRFNEGLPIREIAQRWQADADKLHTEYARARREFKAALHEVISGYHQGSSESIERECEKLRELVA